MWSNKWWNTVCSARRMSVIFMVCVKQIVCLANNRQRKIPPADFFAKGAAE
jgi:hypothetical protein